MSLRAIMTVSTRAGTRKAIVATPRCCRTRVTRHQRELETQVRRSGPRRRKRRRHRRPNRSRPTASHRKSTNSDTARKAGDLGSRCVGCDRGISLGHRRDREARPYRRSGGGGVSSGQRRRRQLGIDSCLSTIPPEDRMPCVLSGPADGGDDGRSSPASHGKKYIAAPGSKFSRSIRLPTRGDIDPERSWLAGTRRVLMVPDYLHYRSVASRAPNTPTLDDPASRVGRRLRSPRC